MKPCEVVAHVTRAEERFQARISDVKWFYRDELAAAAFAFAAELERADPERAAATRKLAALVKTPQRMRDAVEDALPSSRRSTPSRPMPPDMEGDEYLHDHMKRFRTRTTKEE